MPLGVQTTNVPPGFRFRPTDQELLGYLSKKAASEPIYLDVIKEVDISRLEPWDIKDLCSIGTGPQDEWYFFRHSSAVGVGTRNYWRTALGLWKARGRDRPILIGSGTMIGLRKTMVYYKRGKKTDWILHQLHLLRDEVAPAPTDHGWAVCRVFKKVSVRRDFHRRRSLRSPLFCPPPPVEQPAVTNSAPISGFLDKLLLPFKALKTVHLNLNLAVFGPFGLMFEFALQ